MKISSDELYRILREEVMAGKYSEEDALPTLRDLEVQYGLHRDTINRVLGVMEGEGLIIRKGRRRYPVHRHRSEDRVIAVEHIFQSNEHPFFSPFASGVIDTFLSSEYGVHLFTHRDKGSGLSGGSVISNLLKRRILQGVVSLIVVPQPEDVDVFKKHGVAVCTMGARLGPRVIVLDMEQAALQGTHYLAKLGFDQIGIIYTSAMEVGTDVKGYRQALSLNDLSYHEENVIDCFDFVQKTVAASVDPNIFQETYFRERPKLIIEGARQCILHRIQAGNFPRSLYIADEFIAIGVMRALLEVGLRVPEDVAVVSHMSHGNGAVELSGLTTIQFNGYSCGVDTARFVIDIAEGRRSADNYLVLQTSLVKGMSCGEMDQAQEDAADAQVDGSGLLHN